MQPDFSFLEGPELLAFSAVPTCFLRCCLEYITFLLSNELLYDLSCYLPHISRYYRCLLFLWALHYSLFSCLWKNFGEKGIRKSFIPLLETKHPYVYVLFIYELTVFFFLNTEPRLQREECSQSWHGFKQRGRKCFHSGVRTPMFPSQPILELLLHT